MKNKTYWHVTTEENVDNIKKHGLIANTSGYINVIKQLEVELEDSYECFAVADYIAVYQVKVQKYILISIDSKGINKAIRKGTNYPVFTCGCIKQPFIDPKFLTFSEIHTVDIDDLANLSGMFTCELTNVKLDDQIEEEMSIIETCLEIGYSSNIGMLSEPTKQDH